MMKKCIYEIYFDGHKHQNKVKNPLRININSIRAQNINIKKYYPLYKNTNRQ